MRTLHNEEFDIWVFAILEKIAKAQQSGRETIILKDLRININNETYPICEAVLKILVDERLVKNFSKEIDKEGEPVLKIKLYKILIDNEYIASFCFGEVRQRGPLPAICRSGDIINLTNDVIKIKKRDNLFVLVDYLFVLVWAEDIIMTGKQAQLQAQLQKKEKQFVRVICYLIPTQIL